MASKKNAQSAEIEKLERDARKASKKLREAREAETERRTLGSYRDIVTDATDAHNELIERQTGYDTNDKARLFQFGAFDGAADGSLVWARLDAVYAVEKDPNEKFTMLKTVDGPLAVTQAPDEVFNEFTRVRFAGSAERVREMQGELLRREDKVRDAKAKRKAKADKKLGTAGSTGPDFQSVSDRIATAFDGDDPDDFFDSDDDAINFVQGVVNGDAEALERLDEITTDESTDS